MVAIVSAMMAVAMAIAAVAMKDVVVIVLVVILWQASRRFYCIVHIKYDKGCARAGT